MPLLATLTDERLSRAHDGVVRLITLAVVLASAPAVADPGARATPRATDRATEPGRPAQRAQAVKPAQAAQPAPAAAAVRAAGPARTAADPAMLVTSRWSSVPLGRGLSLEDQITDRLTEIGNTLGQHLDRLSHDMFVLSVDGRKRRAHLRLGGGTGELVMLRFDGDIQFQDLDAQVDAHFDLGFHGHLLRLELPAFQMQAAAYRGDYGVQIEVPLFQRAF